MLGVTKEVIHAFEIGFDEGGNPILKLTLENGSSVRLPVGDVAEGARNSLGEIIENEFNRDPRGDPERTQPDPAGDQGSAGNQGDGKTRMTEDEEYFRAKRRANGKEYHKTLNPISCDGASASEDYLIDQPPAQ
jgi:hypothetical protein